MYQKTRLKSKRNLVYRIIEDNNSYISKKFTYKDDMEKELEILHLLNDSKIRVPKVLGIMEDTLFLEDLGEDTLLDWYEEEEEKKSTAYKDTLIKLINWMKSFYKITKSYYNKDIILYDINFRNFIIKDNEIYGIDLEMAKEGEIKEDLGKILAFGLTYEPAETSWKKDFSKSILNFFSEEFDIDEDAILEVKKNEMEEIKRRRV